MPPITDVELGGGEEVRDDCGTRVCPGHELERNRDRRHAVAGQRGVDEHSNRSAPRPRPSSMMSRRSRLGRVDATSNEPVRSVKPLVHPVDASSFHMAGIPGEQPRDWRLLPAASLL